MDIAAIPLQFHKKAQARSPQTLRGDDWSTGYISRPNINGEESFKLKCDQIDLTGWLEQVHFCFLDMQPVFIFGSFVRGEDNVMWA